MGHPIDDDYTSVNFHGMAQAAADFSLIYRLLKDELDALEKDLNVLLSDWIGDPATGYDAAKAVWRGAAEKMNGDLQKLGITIQDIHANYSAAERQNYSLWQV